MSIKLSLLTSLIAALSLSLVAAQETVREPFAVDFGDFQTQAVLSYPANEEGPFPTLLLIHGSTPMDMNGSVFAFTPKGQPVLISAIFRDVADFLNRNGFAVLRYNKHYVTGPGQADYKAYYSDVDLPQLLSDAEKVLEAAKAKPQVDDEHIYLYGWSEGSTVAAELAVNHPEINGLILQGPVARSWRETFEAQIREAGLPYVERFAGDGRVTAAVLRRVQVGDGGLVAKGIVSYLADPSFFQTRELEVSGSLDRNGDGVIDIEGEFLAGGLDGTLDFLLSPTGPLSIYAEGRALPSLLEQVSRLELPVLILQGANDASTPARGARALAEGANVTLYVYKGLGHSLGKTPSVVADNFQPIAERPLRDLVAWLKTQGAQ